MLLLASRTFTTEARVQAPPSAVLALLDDPPGYMRLNPLVIGVEQDRAQPDIWYVTDRLRLLGLPYDLRYKVRWSRVEGGLDTEVWSAMGTRLHNALRVLPEGAGARVQETVQLTAPRPLVGYACATAQAAHRDLLERLRQRAEGGT